MLSEVKIDVGSFGIQKNKKKTPIEACVIEAPVKSTPNGVKNFLEGFLYNRSLLESVAKDSKISGSLVYIIYLFIHFRQV